MTRSPRHSSALIYLLAWQRGLVARILALPPLVWLGEVSYGIYILHWPLWWWTATLSHRWLRLDSAAPLLVPIYLAVLLGGVSLSYIVLERPARRFLRRRLSGIAGAASSATTPAVAHVAAVR